MKSTAEVLKETDISYAMLMRLKDLGVVPKPTLRGRGQGGGRGVVGVFPDEVMDIINWAKEKQESGLSLTQIADRWRQRTIAEERFVVPAPNRDIVKWAIDIFAKYGERYADDELIYSTLSEVEKKDDGTISIELKRESVPRK